LRPHLNHGLWNNLLFERLTALADRRTVSNSFLARRFSGTIVPHGRDTATFRPGRWDRIALRRRHGLPADEKIVVFCGTLHPYKGVDDLIEALEGAGADRPSLLLVGVGDDAAGRATLERARTRLAGRVHCFGPQRFARLPEFLSLADAAVIPQRDSRATVGQMPAKLFDAMALGVPVISTAVSDIPAALSGAGWVVPPDDPAALREAIRELFADPAEAARRAELARRRCVERYSWDAMERILLEVFAC
jgi:glycosyltransferase involved in cell wall biosynthesis